MKNSKASKNKLLKPAKKILKSKKEIPGNPKSRIPHSEIRIPKSGIPQSKLRNPKFAALRKEAEEILKSKKGIPGKISDMDFPELLQEFLVYQAELEIQNEELRVAQLQFEESRNKYSDLYDFAPIGYFTFNRHGKILEVNLTGAQQFGIGRRLLLRKPFSLHVSGEDKRIFFSHLEKVFETGEKQTCELKLIKKDSSQFYAQLESIAVSDNAGNYSCRTAISDMTEKKRAEDERKHFASFPKLNPNPVLELDSSGKITFCNDAAYWILEELNLKNANVFLPEDITDILNALEQKNDVQLYREVRIKDRIFGENLYFVPQFNSMRIYATDITDRKSYQEALQNALEESRRREAEISALLEASSTVLKYPDFNTAARAIFDSCKNLIGATSGYIALLSKDGTENEVLFLDSGGLPCTVDSTLPMPIRGLRGEAFQSVKTVYDNDFAASKWMQFMPEGHVRLDNVMFAPMVIEGKTIGLLGIANKPGDFTENDARLASAFAELAAIALTQKRAEEEIKRSNALLNGINEIFKGALTCETDEELAKICLRVAEEVTGSKFGFIDEIGQDSLLHDIAIDMGWEPCSMYDKTGHRRPPGDFKLHGIYGRVLLDRKSFYTNDPSSHPDSIGTPDGHPPLKAFLGVPLIHGSHTIGMIAVGNRDGGYRQEDLDSLEALAPAIVEALHRVRAERALSDSRKDLSHAQAVGNIGSWRLNVKQNVLTWSDENHRIFGIPKGTPMTYETFLSTVHPDDREYVDKKWKAGLAGEHYDIEHRIIVEGQIKWVREKAHLEFDKNGELLGGFGTTQDITERKKAEEALRESEEKFKTIYDGSIDGILVADVENKKFLMGNKAICNMLGYSQDEIKNLAVRDIHPQENLPLIEKQFEIMARGEAISNENIPVKRKDGGIFYVDIMATHITLSGRKYIVGSFRDITERKKAEESLRYERQKLINILDSIPDGVYIVNEQYDIEYVNPFLQKIYGPVKRQKCYEYFENQKEVCSWCKGQEVFKDKTTCRWEWYSPKTKKTYDLIDTPLINPDGSISKLEIFRDITERKRMEEELRKSRDELEMRVKERTAELSNAYKTVKAERQQLYDVLDTLPAYVVLLSTDYHVPFANRFFEERFGKSNGKRCYEYLFNRAEPCEICETYSVLKTNAPHHWEWTGPDGRNYDIYDFPFRDTDGSNLIMEVGIDITERKQAEMAIKEREKKYKMLIEQASDGIVILDQELNVIEANSMVSEITGYSREELLSMNTSDIMPPDELTSIAPSLQRVLSGETVVEERKLIHKNGSHVSIDVSVKMLENRLIQVIFRDITQKKEIQGRIHTTNRLLELFVKTSSKKEYLDSVIDLLHEWTGCNCIGIRVLDKEGNIPFGSYRGFSLDFWQQENWISVKNHQCACIRVVLQKPDPQDMKMMTPNGSFRCNNTEEFARWLTEKDLSRYRGLCIQMGFKSLAIVPIHYKETVLGAFHFADRREGMVPLEKIEFIESVSPLVGEAILRFSAEEELLQSEARLSEAQSIAHLGNWDWNIQTNQLHWSDEIYRIFGLSPQQFGATYDSFLNSIHPEDRESVKKAVNEALYEKKTYMIDHRIVLPDGTVRIVYEQAEVSFDDDGKPIRMHGIVRDITERKRAEEELKKSYRQLRNLSEHLQSIREEERMNIAREIHDELGQALTALKIDISMIGNKLYPDHKPLVEKTESIMERIDATIQVVKKICTELRPTVLDHFGLSAAIEWQAEDFQKRTGINCKVSFHPEDIVLDQDISIVIFRIFQEALTNIMRHADATEVKASLKAKDGMIKLEVMDNGKGITEEEITNSNSFGLLGIRERVNFLGGNVTISGISNKGTTIKVNIPFKKKGEGHDEDTHR